MRATQPIAVCVFCAFAHNALTSLVAGVLLSVARPWMAVGTSAVLTGAAVVLISALCALLLGFYFGREVAKRTGGGPWVAAAFGLLSVPGCVLAITGG